MWYHFSVSIIRVFLTTDLAFSEFLNIDLFFYSCHGLTEWFTLAVSLFNALMRDHNGLPISCQMVFHFKTRLATTISIRANIPFKISLFLNGQST